MMEKRCELAALESGGARRFWRPSHLPARTHTRATARLGPANGRHTQRQTTERENHPHAPFPSPLSLGATHTETSAPGARALAACRLIEGTLRLTHARHPHPAHPTPAEARPCERARRPHARTHTPCKGKKKKDALSLHPSRSPTSISLHPISSLHAKCTVGSLGRGYSTESTLYSAYSSTAALMASCENERPSRATKSAQA